MLPIRVFATGIKAFDWQKFLLRPLSTWFSKNQRSNCSLMFLIHWFSNSWFLDWPPKRAFDRMIQFWSQLQALLHGTYKWLYTPCKTKVLVRQDSSCLCGLLRQSVASFPDSQCILTWFIESLLVEPGNELGHSNLMFCFMSTPTLYFAKMIYKCKLVGVVSKERMCT